ncbi:SGNH/GDSL hydrolase family protein [Paraglaciecola aquimarina]|uniref:SGNH/GDSL hydrolase family protein n=1 Tax=Paraglaciecola algarum TaxID=3050085 RepID=A0ABS9D2F8_9ALTE|nr:SGNH/GDSL hydrolase family protein [Paraglaciecola sp. G1-23]MCF2947099.1 SGNH/GDSL hydrolase family protein [Paraglaciecola sp. G1-23]
MKLFMSASLSACIVIFSAFGNVQAVPDFEKDDVMVFVGDSITHGGSYHKDIFLFHATRFPNKPFKYYNAGISGDTAQGTIKRFSQDVALHKPTKASIMLGMNDVGGWLYQTTPTNKLQKDKLLQEQKLVREKYLTNMQALIDSFKTINSKVTLITPSIYDQTAKVTTPNNPGRNDELANYGTHLSYLAAINNTALVDFQGPMLHVNRKWQQQNPSSSIVSNDRVHPGEQGHFLMAYSFLKAQGMQDSHVAKFQFNAEDNKDFTAYNCALDAEPVVNTTSVVFSCKTLALPFPLNSEQEFLLLDISFQQEMNQMPFQVTGLKAGDYSLSIGGVLVGKYTHKQLLKGIDLGANKLTPMYKRALKVKELNDLRAQTSGKVRNIQHVKFTMLSKYPETDLSNETIVKQVLVKHLDKSIGKPWHSYLQGVVSSYLEFAKDETQLRKNIDALFNEIYQINQSKTLQWKLEKI